MIEKIDESWLEINFMVLFNPDDANITDVVNWSKIAEEITGHEFLFDISILP